jgi:hypothetical protein
VLLIWLRSVNVEIETSYVKSIYIKVRSVRTRIWCQILPIVKGNEKNAIVDALILSNNAKLPLFTMHPFRINMRLAQALAALLSGCQVCEEDQRQLQYADMLIKFSQNQDSTWCQEVKSIDENTTSLDFPYLKYITKTNQVTDRLVVSERKHFLSRDIMFK